MGVDGGDTVISKFIPQIFHSALGLNKNMFLLVASKNGILSSIEFETEDKARNMARTLTTAAPVGAGLQFDYLVVVPK